jgi:hypothetical protein
MERAAPQPEPFHVEDPETGPADRPDPGQSRHRGVPHHPPILGDLAIGLTDGQFGVRRFWIFLVGMNP